MFHIRYRLCQPLPGPYRFKPLWRTNSSVRICSLLAVLVRSGLLVVPYDGLLSVSSDGSRPVGEALSSHLVRPAEGREAVSRVWDQGLDQGARWFGANPTCRS
jgi:hypothetical protein